MGCDCSSNYTPEAFLNEFWEGLKIRNELVQDVIEIIRAKKNSTKNITQNKWDILIRDLIEHTRFIEESHKVFNAGLEQARAQNNEGLIFLCFLFLAKGEVIEFNKKFISFSMTQGGLRDSISISNEASSTLMDKSKFEEILLFYVNFISLNCVKPLESVVENKEAFTNYLNQAFCIENQIQLVQEKLLNECNELKQIPIQEYFNQNLALLKNDVELRRLLSEIAMQKISIKNNK